MGGQTLRYAACQDLSANVSTGYTLLYTLSDNGNGTCTLDGAMERPASAPAWVAFGLASCPDCGMLKGSAVIANTNASSPTGARPLGPSCTGCWCLGSFVAAEPAGCTAGTIGSMSLDTKVCSRAQGGTS